MGEIGGHVKLRAYNGQEIVRRVVNRKKETIYVCNDDEYQKALVEKREPISVGFNVKYILDSKIT